MLRPPIRTMIDSSRNRRSLRLAEYDYGSTGAYFITICTNGRVSLFGEIVHDSVTLNKLGEIVAACWTDLPHHFLNIELDCFIVMPNHIHGLIEITDNPPANSVEIRHPAPEHYSPRKVQPGSLASIVRSFKAASSRQINILSRTPGATIWQRNYYDHIVRQESELQRIREYIVNNPARWAEDEENPHAMRAVGLRSKG